MSLDGFDRLLGKSPLPTEPLARIMRVVQTGPGGLWCLPLRGDQTKKIGPCLGSTTKPVASNFEPGHTHSLVSIPLGSLVLVITTEDGPWVTPQHLDTFLPPS